MIGLDEAGRGPVLGPLVVGAVKVADEGELGQMGVRDSKKLTPKRREKLFQELKTCVEFSIASVSAAKIDSMRKSLTLNEVEKRLFVEALTNLDYKNEVVYVDCCDTNETRFSDDLMSMIDGPVKIHSSHKADEKYLCVSAASIVAKVYRDKYIGQLDSMAQEKWGMRIGSGYPSDPVTQGFLQYLHENERNLPSFVRHSWKTVSRLSQSTLDPYNE